MKVSKLQIDAEHTLRLMEGKSVAIRVPPGTEIVELRIEPQAKDRDSISKIIDVFFNGRRA